MSPGHGHEHPQPHEAAPHAHLHASKEVQTDHPDHSATAGEGEHDHEHAQRSGLPGLLDRLGILHSHGHSASSDAVLETSAKGIRTVQISLVLLGATAAFQVAVVLASGSVALMADTIHNFTDALTALPLWLAFVLGRRAASKRYTYGHGRAEDLAGVVIVLIIAASAVVAGYESVRRIFDPTPLINVEWVMVAAIVGFIGNEAVAILRIRTGREIGSAALIVDGQHARIDGLTSLAVLVGALGVLAGWPAADPIVGGVITLAILFIVKDSAAMVWHRLMDAVDPELVVQLEDAAIASLAAAPEVRGVADLRVRWLGHKLQLELNLIVDEEMKTRDSHRLAEHLRHEVFHRFPQIASIIVHIDPDGRDGTDPHVLTKHHLPVNQALKT